MKQFVLSLIRFYRNFIPKPVLGCRFTPTCSQYSYQAISKYGILHGSFLSAKRLLKCHPWHSGGLDPLPLN